MKIKKIPIIGPPLSNLASKIHHKFYFRNSGDYWEKRYKQGGNSGTGSYSRHAEFKAEILNTFVLENKIESVLELGCGDGNQLKMFDFKRYVGYDISQTILNACLKEYSSDKSKEFRHISKFVSEDFDLAMSLDVIYHLVEDEVFTSHMRLLFNDSHKNVVIYSSNFNDDYDGKTTVHVRHRKFVDWVENNAINFKLTKHIVNRNPYQGDETIGSLADFYFYSKS